MQRINDDAYSASQNDSGNIICTDLTAGTFTPWIFQLKQ